MRKSGRLASIHEDDDDHPVDLDTNQTDSKTKKLFTPTIPTVRRKKIVEDEVDVAVQNVQNDRNSQKGNNRKPLSSRSTVSNPTIVSGPLSLGPAAMPRSSSSRSSSSTPSTAVFAARSLTRPTQNSSLDATSPLNDSVPVEEEFSSESFNSNATDLVKPVALLDISARTCDSFTNFQVETGKLFLFQMPPVLPSLANQQPDQSTNKWPESAQGRYGKLCRYKSGKIVLILENGVEFIVNPSIDADPQNTSVLAIDPEFAQSFNLGPIENKFVCTPDFEKFQKLSNK